MPKSTIQSMEVGYLIPLSTLENRRFKLKALAASVMSVCTGDFPGGLGMECPINTLHPGATFLVSLLGSDNTGL